jgi:hypothetical protein
MTSRNTAMITVTSGLLLAFPPLTDTSVLRNVPNP